ncbi:MAG TPA: translation elongation factor Ts [bacterium]|nr:translation elongation factor Ts [bacterium]
MPDRKGAATEVTAAQVKALRERTGAGIIDCRNALAECAGDVEKAVQVLRAKGLAAAAKRTGRVANDGIVTSYIHAGGRLGVLVEINCETDFVARTEEFKTLARDIAMQIAATDPRYVSREEIPVDALDSERAAYVAQAIADGKPEAIAARIAEGKLEKYFSTVCLLDQPFIRDEGAKPRTVGEVVHDAISRTKENIKIRRFARFKLGEA